MDIGQYSKDFFDLRNERLSIAQEAINNAPNQDVLLADIANLIEAAYILGKLNKQQPQGFVSNKTKSENN